MATFIVYGSMPAVGVGQSSEGEFLVGGGIPDSVQLSTNGTTWVSGSTGITRLGGVFTASLLYSSETGDTTVVVTGTPTEAGTANLYVRLVEDGDPSIAYGPAQLRVFPAGTLTGAPSKIEASTSATAFAFRSAEPITCRTPPDATDVYWVSVNSNGYAVTGGFRARIRIGGASGTIYTSPICPASSDICAFVKMNTDGTVEDIAWAQGIVAAHTWTVDPYGDQIFIQGTNASFYNRNGSLAHTATGTSLMRYVVSTGTWAWGTVPTNVTLCNIAYDTYPVVAFLIAAGTTATWPGGWSYSNTSSYAQLIVARLSGSTGQIVWHKVAFSSTRSIAGFSRVVAKGDWVYVTAQTTSTSSSFTINMDGNTTATCRGAYRLNASTGAVSWAANLDGQFDRGDLSYSYLVLTDDALVMPVYPTGSWAASRILGLSPSTGAQVFFLNETALGFSVFSTSGLYVAPDSENRLWIGGEFLNGQSRIGIYDGSTVIRAQANRSSAYVVSRGNPVNGGYIASIASSGMFNFVNANGTTAIASTSLPENAHQFLSTSGEWGELEGGTGVDPGTGGTAEPSRPASSNWPGTRAQDAGWMADVTGYDPELSTTAGVLQVWRPSTATWVTGTVNLGKVVIAVTDLSLGLGDGALSASVMATSDAGWYGTVNVRTRWKVGSRIGPVKTFSTTVTNIPEATDAPNGVTFETVENETVEKWVSFDDDPDFVSSYTWQLSPQTEAPYSTTGTTITVLDGALTAGTAEIVSVDNANKRARVRYSPGDWNGYTSFSVRVSNGVWSDWTTLAVDVAARADAPTAPTGTVPALDEDGTATMVVSWTDPDDLDGTASADSGYQLRLAPTDSGFTDLDFVDAGKLIVRVLSYSETNLEATLRLEAKANQTGSFSFRAQVKDTSDPTVKRSAITTFTGTIGAVDDTPEQPVPSRMPLARPEQSVQQKFTTRDPDSDTSWTFQIAAVGSSSWGSTVTIPSVGTLTLVDTDTSNKNAVVRLDQIAGGATVSRYQFRIRVTDSSARTSPPTLVTGYVSTPAAGVWLQQVTRTSSAATIGTVTPLTTVRSLTATESLAGPGDAEVTVSAGEIAARAKAVGVTVAQLLEPGAVELLIAAGGETVWVGPVTDVSWDAAADEVSISARGLLSYFETRYLPADVTYTNTNGSGIVLDLVSDAQTLPYGNVAVTDGTVESTANHTLTFQAGTSITDAIYQVADQVNGPEVWIDADRQLRSATTRGIDNRDRVRVTSGMCEVMSWSGQGDDIVTAATVNGQGGATGSYQDTAAMARFGRVERVVDAAQLTTNSACEALAQKIVEASARQAVALTVQVPLTPDRPFGPSDVEVGNRVTVDVWDPQLGQVLGVYRIVNRSLELTGEVFTARLDLEPVPVIGGNLRVIASRSRHNPEVMYLLSDLQALR